MQSIWALISLDATVSKLGPQVDVQVALQLPHCRGFGWDRVNFHKKLGGDMAGMADPN